MNLKSILIVLGLALAVAAVTLAVVYAPPVWVALAGLGGYALAMVGFVVHVAVSAPKPTASKPAVIVHEDGSIEVRS